MLEFSHNQAQTLMLAAMGLATPPLHPATKADVLSIIRQMALLQIDTINVVARSPYLVLWSRLGEYDAGWLDELLAEGQLFEYWSHEACFIPIEDYPLYLRLMQHTRRAQRAQNWLEENQAETEQFLANVKANGPVRSSDFERTDGIKGSWWNWKPEKVMLERLHTAGHLMIARRHNFHRIYDLREKILPGWNNNPPPALEEVRRVMALKAVKALGITTAKWVADYFRTDKRETTLLIEKLAAEGILASAQIASFNKETAYIHPENLALAEQVLAGKVQPELTTLLSPFDPLVWDRARVLAMFNFDYRIECYTPEARRKYGYFTLPILHRGELVGRLDAKAHRSEGKFEVKKLFLEPGVVVTPELKQELYAALQNCANWHKTPQLTINWASDAALLASA